MATKPLTVSIVESATRKAAINVGLTILCFISHHVTTRGSLHILRTGSQKQ